MFSNFVRSPLKTLFFSHFLPYSFRKAPKSSALKLSVVSKKQKFLQKFLITLKTVPQIVSNKKLLLQMVSILSDLYTKKWKKARLGFFPARIGSSALNNSPSVSSQTRKARPGSRLFIINFSLEFCRLNQTIAAIFTTIDNAEFFCFCVCVDEEVMAQHVHL